MAVFRLKKGEPIDRGLSRLVRSEFETALAALARPAPRGEDVHEARKSIKKIRAVLRALRDDLGNGYRSENRRLRRAARGLSSVRDADVMSEVFRGLRRRYLSPLAPPARKAIAQVLRGRRREARKRSGEEFARVLRALRASLRSVPDRIQRAGEIDAVRAGITLGYRRACRVMQTLRRDSDAAAFHSWRRRVKDHWNQVRLFEDRSGAARARARLVGRLDTALGDDHNLELLLAAALAAAKDFGGARTSSLLVGCISGRQASLRRRALKLGRRLFADSPRRFGASASTWWRTAGG